MKPATDDKPSAAAAYVDPVIEAYKKDVDRTLIRHNLTLTVDQRIQNLQNFMKDCEELRRAMDRAKAERRQSSAVAEAIREQPEREPPA